MARYLNHDVEPFLARCLMSLPEIRLQFQVDPELGIEQDIILVYGDITEQVYVEIHEPKTPVRA